MGLPLFAVSHDGRQGVGQMNDYADTFVADIVTGQTHYLPPGLGLNVSSWGENGGLLGGRSVSDGAWGYSFQAELIQINTPPTGVTYSLTDDAGGRFQVDPVTGEVTVADAICWSTRRHLAPGHGPRDRRGRLDPE